MDVFMDTRHCPYCGEEIEANARKCKYCDEWLEEPTKQEVVEEPPRIIPCPVCGEEIGEDTEVCPHCHERVGKARAIPVVHAEERRDEEGETRREKKVDSIENQPERMEDSSPDAGNGRKESFFQYYFVDAFIRHYVDFKGKTSRKQYWLGFVCYLLTMLLLGCLDMMMRIPFISITLGSLALTLPTIAIVVRRLHDVGKSGWWIFIYCIPLAGPIWLLVLLLQKGETKAKPVKHSIYDVIVWLVLVFALAGAYYINAEMTKTPGMVSDKLETRESNTGKSKKFYGLINNKYKCTFNLRFGKTDENGVQRVEGSYYYDKYGDKNTIKLEGIYVVDDELLNIVEILEDGSPKCEIVVSKSDEGFEGEFIRQPDGERMKLLMFMSRESGDGVK